MKTDERSTFLRNRAAFRRQYIALSPPAEAIIDIEGETYIDPLWVADNKKHSSMFNRMLQGGYAWGYI